MARPLPEQLLADSPLWTSCDGGTLIVACSGGRDSVALALAARAVLAAGHFTVFCEVAPKLVLWHLDHGLRPGSAADAKFVEELGAKLGAPVITETADLKAQAHHDGGNVEELARRERYRRLLELCQSPPPGSPVVLPAVAITAHHLGDQAETILHHIVRGTHLGGLRGIAPQYEDYIYRPWLSLPPEEIQPYLEALGQDWRVDETNADTALTRNLLRHEVVPRLLQINPRAREHIAGLARTAGDAHALYERELDRISVQSATATDLARRLPTCCPPAGVYESHIKLDGWDNPDLLAGFSARRLADRLGGLTQVEHGSLGEWSADPVDQLHVRGSSLSLTGRIRLVLQAGAMGEQEVLPLQMEHPGEAVFGELQVNFGNADPEALAAHRRAVAAAPEQIREWLAVVLAAASAERANAAWSCFLPQSVKLPLTLRMWREGDRMTLTDGSTKKLGDIFTDAKVPRLFRPVWAVLTDAAGEVLWLPALADGLAMKIKPPEEPAWLITLSHQR